MVEEIVVYLEDMEAYLEPEEYRSFLKARQEVEKYCQRNAEYEKKKADAEKSTEECRKKRSEAKNDIERICWESSAIVSSTEAVLMPAPYYPVYYFVEHDRYIELVRKRKLEQLEEEKHRKAEEEAERRRKEERKEHEKQIMLATMKREMLAASEWEQFQKTFNSTINDLKHQLANPKPPKSVSGCSSEVLNYHPEVWCDLTLLSDDEARAWAKPQILEKIPKLLIPFVTWELASEILAIPKVKYELLGIASLTWDFDIYVKSKVDLWLKQSTITKEFHGWEYVSPIKPQKIGTLFLGADYWDSEEGFSTPIPLLALLVEGELEGPGIEIFIRDRSCTVYTVDGFDDYFVKLHQKFIGFIKDSAKGGSLVAGLLGKGMIDEVTAQLVEVKWSEPLPVSGKLGDAGGSDLESPVAKLVELGWTQADAKKAVETTTFPNNATPKEMVSIILGKSY